MKKSILSFQWDRHAKWFTGIAFLLLILIPSMQALAINTINPSAPSAPPAEISPISGGSAYGSSSSSPSSDDIKKAIQELQKEISARMDASKAQIEGLFFAAYSDLTNKTELPNLATQNPANAYQFVATEGSSSTTTLPVYDLVADSVQKAASQKLQASLSTGNAESQRQILLQPLTTGSDATVNMLDAQSLLGPLTYSTPDTQNLAERAVEFLSDYASPIGTIDLQKLHDKKPELEASRSGQEYKVKVFTQAAIRSLLLGNLYESLESRIPVKDLGKVSGMPDKNDASLAEVTKYIASRRISDKTWYDTINKAPPGVVQRETVFLLSEIEWQLYQLNHNNERMLQTMTAMAVLNLRSNNMLPDQNDISLKAAVEGTEVAPPEASPESKYTIPSTSSGTTNTNAVPSVPTQ